MSTACGAQRPITHRPRPGREEKPPQKTPGWETGHRPAHLIDVLQVEPGAEGTRGQVQVGELELGHAGADVPLVLVNAEGGEAQAVLLQRRRVQRDGEALVEGHGAGAPLDLPRGRGWMAVAPLGLGATAQTYLTFPRARGRLSRTGIQDLGGVRWGNPQLRTQPEPTGIATPDRAQRGRCFL